MENKTMENWKRSCVRIGAPTNLLAAATSFIPVLWLCSTYDCWPALDVVLMAWSMVALSFVPMTTRVDAQLFYECNIELMRSLYGAVYIKRLFKERLAELRE